MLKRMICWVLTLCVVLSLAAMPAQAADSNEETIFLFLRTELQLNEAAACGVLASIAEESGFEPTAYNPAGYYGLCQWGGGRQQALYAFCAENGLDSASLEGQLRFLKHELETAEYAALAAMQAIENTAEGAYQAGWSWAQSYGPLRPARRRGAIEILAGLRGLSPARAGDRRADGRADDGEHSAAGNARRIRGISVAEARRAGARNRQQSFYGREALGLLLQGRALGAGIRHRAGRARVLPGRALHPHRGAHAPVAHERRARR